MDASQGWPDASRGCRPSSPSLAIPSSPLPSTAAQITRRVPCRMTPLQLQLYTDILAKDFDKVHAMGACGRAG